MTKEFDIVVHGATLQAASSQSIYLPALTQGSNGPWVAEAWKNFKQ
jgi:hypothetical protein